ncbi:aminotransferase class III-fold pyridoxal phosphate-dependent enzyme [Streptomyces sp. MA5143a]|uniref:aminotransferase class III-fold pyridoxal phosphate-dependent enzyme n=1 Tax=Streptomyces sp. MA5143a TaxID=2083010 RepID=UPI000D1BC4B1|nr:aminotransferase class III-fold pyridoxal phosphate-dependent enzyme [Streptomyces sp. MA5143a]SPF04834.1 2,2-dialkylglycine decarboxylase [Streptomyces sp. MA5143a]
MTSVTTTDRDGAALPGPTGHLPGPLLDHVLRRSFGLEGYVQHPLGGEVDQNVRITGDDGTRYFVRVTLAEPDSADILWQNTLLRHLAATVPGLPVPRLVPTREGQCLADVVHEGRTHVVRVMSWLEGRVLADLDDHPAALLRRWGEAAGRLSLGLSGMEPPVGLAPHDWDMRRAAEIVEASLHAVQDADRRESVRTIMGWYDALLPVLDRLPCSVLHQDLNDANVLADAGEDGVPQISGIVDLGDSLYGVRAAEVAIAAGYAMVRKADPLTAAAEVVAGFHSVLPLTEEELAAVYPLAAARLCMNAVTWTRRVAESDTPYGRSRVRHTWPTIARVARICPEVAEATFRVACGLPPTREQGRLAEVLAETAREGAPYAPAPRLLDLRPASDLYDDVDWHDARAVRARVDDILDGRRRRGYVPHLSASLLQGGRRRPGVDEPATVQVGGTLILAEAEEVAGPLSGVVESHGGPGEPLVLRHVVGGLEFWTCWWGLADPPPVGARVPAGAPLGRAGASEETDPLGPRVQVQVHRTARTATWPPPRAVPPSKRQVWSQLSPDPARLLGFTESPTVAPAVDDVVSVRRRHIARSQRNYYRRPMNLVRGRDVWFHDEDGLAYLDSLNNVTHVGHAEPRVTAAATRQMRKLNTNSRFVYPQIASYVQKLVATLPDPLEVVFLVCSGSEANDLALRIARQVTGRRHIVNIDGAYHGNTGVVTGISPNRYKGPGGAGAPATTHEVAIPDRYRGTYGYDDADAGARYARDAAAVIERISADGRPPAAFIAESLMGSGGNIVFPDGYLDGVFTAARRAGALCVSDEVQVGVGRLGPWWGFELQGVVPDIVTMGKPLGNGHPLAAVVTTREIADAFDTGMKYFNTFGGNPVSCAIGEAVLDIVERDGLRENAVKVGGYFARSLRELQRRQPLIGDVRAQGLYLGVELVRDRTTKVPATEQAFMVTELMKERGVIVFPNGVHDNVLKIKPPMTFRREHVDLYVDALDEVLSLPELRSAVQS